MRNLSNLPTRAGEFINRFHMLPEGTHVLCAVSGGADSMALLTFLCHLSQQRNLTVSAAHYNHCLRGEESLRDEEFVVHWCHLHQIPIYVQRGNVQKESMETGEGIEETARKMRYSFLRESARKSGASCIATAHNADDNLETVLLHLTRGTGLDGLVGIPPVRNDIIRPLLTCTREDILLWLKDTQTPHVEDSSNTDTAYSRNRIRHEIIPILRDLNPSLSLTLAGSLNHLRADCDYLNTQADAFLSCAEPCEGGLRIPVDRLLSLPEAMSSRVLKRALSRLSFWDVSSGHLAEGLALCRQTKPSGQVVLPCGAILQREYEYLVLKNTSTNSEKLISCLLSYEGITETGTPWNISCRTELCPASASQGSNIFYLSRSKVQKEIYVRSRQTGDMLRLPGRKNRSLKKWLIDEKIPRHIRDTLPVLVDSDGILAVAGLGPEENRLARPGEESLRIEFMSKNPDSITEFNPKHREL